MYLQTSLRFSRDGAGQSTNLKLEIESTKRDHLNFVSVLIRLIESLRFDDGKGKGKGNATNQ